MSEPSVPGRSTSPASSGDAAPARQRRRGRFRPRRPRPGEDVRHRQRAAGRRLHRRRRHGDRADRRQRRRQVHARQGALRGVYPPDDGTILLDGEPVSFRLAARRPPPGHRDRLPGPRPRTAPRRRRQRVPRAGDPPGAASSPTSGQCAGARWPRSATSRSTTVQDLAVPVALLSGGQRQSVAIARSALWAKRVIFFDEPTAALGVVQTRTRPRPHPTGARPRSRRRADHAHPARRPRGGRPRGGAALRAPLGALRAGRRHDRAAGGGDHRRLQQRAPSGGDRTMSDRRRRRRRPRPADGDRRDRVVLTPTTTTPAGAACAAASGRSAGATRWSCSPSRLRSSPSPSATRFLTRTNLILTAQNVAVLTVVACGSTFVLITAGVDLSVGSVAILGEVVAAKTIIAAGAQRGRRRLPRHRRRRRRRAALRRSSTASGSPT